MNTNIRNILSGSIITGVLLVSGSAFADTTPPAGGWGGMRSGHMPGVFGTVSSVSGSQIIVANPRDNTTYTVDASKATIMKDNATSSVSAIASGDMVMVQGSVNGTNVVATKIRDGKMGGRGMGKMGPRDMMDGTSSEPRPQSIIQGNGQPVIGGTISAISGSTLTITNKSNVAYSVQASSATIEKAGATSTLSSLAIGDNVVVQGTVNGSTVAATSVMDQGPTPTTPAPQAGNDAGTPPAHRGGFMGMFGGFFQHLFGFF